MSQPNKLALSLFFAAPIFYYAFYQKKLMAREDEKRKEAENFSGIIRPPFPLEIRKALSTCRLAYLSTVDVDDNSSHLSLMRFTYLKDEEDGEVVVLSTQRATKKFDLLQRQNGVALLVHDFPQFGDGSDGVSSITLNGKAQILPPGAKAERYRKAHLAHNPEYPQFIEGPDIAILLIIVTSARICNINDQVTKWSIGGK